MNDLTALKTRAEAMLHEYIEAVQVGVNVGSKLQCSLCIDMAEKAINPTNAMPMYIFLFEPLLPAPPSDFRRLTSIPA
jgi:hypothetical protein